jgi:aminopeptidase N
VLANIGTETDAFGVSRIPGYGAQAVNSFSAPANRPALRDHWEQGLRKLLENAEPGSDHQLSFARAYAAAARSDEALDHLEGLLDGSVTLNGLAVDTDLRWTILTALASVGRVDRARIDEELASDNTISGHEKAAAAIAALPDAASKEQSWVAARSKGTPNETQRHIAYIWDTAGQQETLAPFLDQYLEAADTIWEELGVQIASTALEYMFPRALTSRETLERVDAWLASSPANPAAKRYVGEGRADIVRALKAQALDAD